MAATMRALTLERYGSPFAWRSLPVPMIGSEEVLVKVRANGLCGTDLKIVAGQVGSVTLPAVIGHELSGEVAEVGKTVTHLAPGDHVVVHIYIGCQICKHCRLGLENQCPRMRRLGFELPGGFGEYVAAPARNVLRVDPSIPLDQVAILSGSIATVFHGLRAKGRIALGEDVLVIGVGGLGIHAVQLAKALGARVLAADISDARLDGAIAHGAAAVINSAREDLASRVRELTNGTGADVVVEIVGGEAITGVLAQSFTCLASGGRLVVLGYAYGKPLTVDSAELVYGQWQVLGTRASTKQDLADVISLVEAGTIKPVVARTFPLAAAAEAFESLRTEPPLGRIVLTS